MSDQKVVDLNQVISMYGPPDLISVSGNYIWYNSVEDLLAATVNSGNSGQRLVSLYSGNEVPLIDRAWVVYRRYAEQDLKILSMKELNTLLGSEGEHRDSRYVWNFGEDFLYATYENKGGHLQVRELSWTSSYGK